MGDYSILITAKINAISSFNCRIKPFMSEPQIIWHLEVIIEHCKRMIRMIHARIKDSPSTALNGMPLLIGRIGPDKIIVDNLFRIAIVTLHTRSNSTHP